MLKIDGSPLVNVRIEAWNAALLVFSARPPGGLQLGRGACGAAGARLGRAWHAPGPHGAAAGGRRLPRAAAFQRLIHY